MSYDSLLTGYSPIDRWKLSDASSPAYATTHNKGIAIPEWSCANLSTVDPTSPGDDPIYATNMCNWFLARQAEGHRIMCFPWNDGNSIPTNFPLMYAVLEGAGL